ncbi:metal ABC transporter permease [Clostridioides difficile]|nr:metal ABC transporter permease [Clostridioides difficile]EGT4545248.1 metal ABC transporter permease [Clostridioides difficile]EGT4612702.1 metal ABC transporter permease [Clostridioides difficile]EGT4731704.1 metal ABC transporter permease [Clostridioides difficile]EGT4779801.1 metal ABC transporter permease [Clostridioides difficile]EGT5365208.1 metal ABC transporter permease [Clostridioides difficile]
MNLVSEMMSYPFIVRAVIVGILVSLCSSLLGVSLVLKKYSMIGEGLSHVSFGAIAIAVALGVSPLKLSIPIVIIVAFLLLRIKESSKIKGDSAIALISSSSLAIGVISIAITTGMNTDVCNYMFGSILAMSKNDVYLSVVLSIVVIFLFTIYYNKIFAITFDENFTKSTGINVNFYNMMIAILTAITIVLGMRMMGAMLISSLIIFPSIISMKIFKSFKSVVISSGLVSILSFCIGMTISYKFSTPTGASIVVVNIIIFILSIIGEKIKSNNRSYI